MDQRAVLIKKYAIAFINWCGEKISRADYIHIDQCAHDFKKNRWALFFLKMPLLSDETKKELLEKYLRDEYQLPDCCFDIINLLIDHKRGELLPLVFAQAAALYRKKHRIMPFYIASSAPLHEKQKTQLVNFLAQQTGCDIIEKYTIDPALIAGIKMQSETFLWEYSIDKKIKQVYQAFLLGEMRNVK